MLASDDGGEQFAESNEGFFHRQVLALAADPSNGGHLLAQLANAPALFLETPDGGQTWSPLAPGLDHRNVKRIYGTPDGWWAALETGGFARYDPLKTTARMGPRRKNPEHSAARPDSSGHSRGSRAAGLAAVRSRGE